jgi:hypothetical protein
MIELGLAYLLELTGYAAEKASTAGDNRGANTTPPTSKPVDILREKIAGGQPFQIKDALKLVADEGTNLGDLFTQDATMLRALGSRLARTENTKELKESLSVFGDDLQHLVKIKNAAGNTLASETVFFAQAHKTAPRQLKSILTELKKLGANLDGAESQLQDDGHITAAIKGIVATVKKGAGWLKQNE